MSRLRERRSWLVLFLILSEFGRDTREMLRAGKHVVFGKVLDAVSMMVVHKIEAVQAGADNKPKLPVLISQCGEL